MISMSNITDGMRASMAFACDNSSKPARCDAEPDKPGPLPPPLLLLLLSLSVLRLFWSKAMSAEATRGSAQT